MATRITSCCRYNELCYDKHVYGYIIFMGMVFCKKKSVFPISSPWKIIFFLNVTMLNFTEIMKTHRKEQCQQDFKRMKSLPWFTSVCWIHCLFFSSSLFLCPETYTEKWHKVKSKCWKRQPSLRAIYCIHLSL